MKPPKLPKDPVDGFTIDWWTFNDVESYHPGPRQHRAIFILNTSWEDFCNRADLKPFHHCDPKDRGAPFVNDWIVLNETEHNGKRCLKFDGRNCGWTGMSDASSSRDREWWKAKFETRDEATAAFLIHAEEHIAYMQKRIVSAEQEIVRVLKLTGQPASKLTKLSPTVVVQRDDLEDLGDALVTGEDTAALNKRLNKMLGAEVF